MAMLYKYRSSQQLQFTLDILLNGRLFAAPFSQLNDPMEGLWHYGGKGMLWPDEIRSVEEQIERYRVLSLSANPVSTLMWSHYADSHRGLAIGVEVANEGDCLTLQVRYQDEYTISGDASDVGADILSKKALPWNYEKEYRVLTPQTFVPVEPKEIIFGIRADKALVELVSRIAFQFCPDIKLTQLRQSELDTYIEPRTN